MKVLRTKFLSRGTLFALGAAALVEMDTILRKCVQGDTTASMKSFQKTRGMASLFLVLLLTTWQIP